MKLLFDQNLSHRLPVRLADLFPESAHIRLVGMDRASDSAIWEFAKQHSYAIVTQDSDFAERAKVFGPPPKVVWLRCGNATPAAVEALLRDNAALIRELCEAGSGPCLEIF